MIFIFYFLSKSGRHVTKYELQCILYKLNTGRVLSARDDLVLDDNLVTVHSVLLFLFLNHHKNEDGKNSEN